nr:cytokine receptor-like factor 2 isoform X1 [Misgurnus anguillicaudatus]
MNSWHLCLHLILPLFFAPKLKAEDVEENGPFTTPGLSDYSETSSDDFTEIVLNEIDPKEMDLKIDTSHGITIKWRTPKDWDAFCYKSEVQYKNQCGKNWTTIEYDNKHELNVLNLPTLSMKQNYDFRIRMKVDCSFDGDWSNWTHIQSWGNQPDPCIEESSSNVWIYVLITVLPLASLLIICLLTRESIRKLILPAVPDPKHFKSRIMDIDQSQWWSSVGQCYEECKTTDVEIVNKSENNKDDQTVAIPEEHDTNMYCIYRGDNTEAQCPQRVFGYIVL